MCTPGSAAAGGCPSKTYRGLDGGKEQGQGLAYLDDGTMIVVDGGSKYIGSTVDITITSVLQTGAGRMIFARVIS